MNNKRNRINEDYKMVTLNMRESLLLFLLLQSTNETELMQELCLLRHFLSSFKYNAYNAHPPTVSLFLFRICPKSLFLYIWAYSASQSLITHLALSLIFIYIIIHTVHVHFRFWLSTENRSTGGLNSIKVFHQ